MEFVPRGVFAQHFGDFGEFEITSEIYEHFVEIEACFAALVENFSEQEGWGAVQGECFGEWEGWFVQVGSWH